MTYGIEKNRAAWVRDEYRRWKHNVERADLQRQALVIDAQKWGMTSMLIELQQSDPPDVAL